MASKKKYGICHLCGEEKLLTYEHVPPRASFNNGKVNLYRGGDVIKNDGKGLKGLKYEQRQQGAGGYYLCSKCNSFVGNKYNNEYLKFANTLGNIIIKEKYDKGCLEIVTEPMNSLAIFKQVMTMFCDTSPICSKDDNLKRFILNPYSNDFDDKKYRLFCYGINTKHKKMIISGDNYKVLCNTIMHFAIITAFPITFILCFDMKDIPDIINDALELTPMAHLNYDEKQQIFCNLNIVEINELLPLSFKK